MFHAIFEGVSNRKIASRINIDTILAHIELKNVVLGYCGERGWLT